MPANSQAGRSERCLRSHRASEFCSKRNPRGADAFMNHHLLRRLAPAFSRELGLANTIMCLL